jgi:hypothetical protein
LNLVTERILAKTVSFVITILGMMKVGVTINQNQKDCVSVELSQMLMEDVNIS